MRSSTLEEEWATQPDAYASAFGDIDGYVEVFRAIMERYNVGFGETCWFDDGFEPEDDPTVQEWVRHGVAVVKPTIDQRAHFIVYAADFMFMESELVEAWSRFTELPAQYVETAFRGVPVAMGDEKLILAQNAYHEGIPADYLREAPYGLFSPHSMNSFFYLRQFWLGQVPADYARQVWGGSMTLRKPHRVLDAWKKGIPAPYAAALINVMPVEAIAQSYQAGMPVEYAIAAYSGSDQEEE